MIEITKNPDVQKIINEGIEAGIIQLCTNVRNQAVELAPVKDGELKGSIIWKTERAGSGGKLNDVKDPKDLDGYVGSPLDYAVYQEFGTRYIPPQPYLRPAITIEALGQTGANVMIKRANEVARGKLTKGSINDRETFGVK